MIEHFTTKKLLTDSECNSIIEYSLKNLNLKPGLIGNDALDEKNRKSDVSFTNYDLEFPFLKTKLLNEISNKIIVKGYDINFENQPFQFTRYSVGEFYNWHTDSSFSGPHSDRYCSVVIQLNDTYSGGDLQMRKTPNNELITFENGKGNLFVFLSNILHRVTEVTNGTRYSLVSWFTLKPNQSFKKTLI